MRVTVLIGIASLFVSSLVAEDETPLAIVPAQAAKSAEDAMEDEQLDKWSQYYQKRVKNYEVRVVDGGEPASLKLIPTPVLRWANPIRDTTHGECYAWTKDGRVRAFATLFSYPYSGGRRVAHEFNAFGNQGLSALYEGTEFWKLPASDALKLVPVPDSPSVAKSAPLRKAQMRKIARDFSAESTERGETRALRLLTAPIYRYDQDQDARVDGGLFAFVMGTDPEILLVLESFKDGSTSEWRFAAARHTYTSLEMSYDGKVVWKNERQSRDEPYYARHGIDQQPAMLE